MGDAEIVREFLVESHENLDRLDRDLIALEKDPSSQETLASVFRTIHTLKGTSGFLAFYQLEAVTHVGESLLARLRDGLLSLSPEMTTALLAMVDAVRQMLGSIETTGHEGERDDRELIAGLTRLLPVEAAKSPPPPAPEQPELPAQHPPQPVQNVGDILVVAGKAKVSDVWAAMEQQQAGDPRRLGEILVEKGAVKPQDVLDALQTQHLARGQSASDTTIRVDVGQLDRLMNRVGELVLLRNQIVQFTNLMEDSALQGTSQRLNLLTTELQEGVMKTRMQPIGNIWSKFPRTVRDVATGCGKQVRIEMEGKETELDKTIIEAIKDPLTHLVRNAVDHGIELPEVRKSAGKSPEGRLLLRAFHEGGQVNIEITDDGAGLDFEKIRSQAVQKGLITSDRAARLSEREITNLIFMPGLSTAEKVTNVSGRGVGMDVVKTNIERIGGTADVHSRRGQGSTVRMKIPLTLAIIPALIVSSAGDRYAIPQVNLLELLRLESERVPGGIELVNGSPVYRLRGRLLPLVYLKRELKTGPDAPDTARLQTASGEEEVLDFAQARGKHTQWLDRLRQVLDGKLAMTAGQAGSSRECALGKWLYSAGLRNYGDMAELQALEATHRQFHERIREVVALRDRGDQSGAEQEFTQVEPLSRKIIDLLMSAERKVSETQNVNIVVLQADDRQFGLVVDEINDTEEIVVKPLGKQLKSINAYAGATIMGDGRVALILDVLGLAQRARLVGEVRARALTENDGGPALAAGGETQCNHVLLFQYGESGRMAIDLALVAHLEEFPRHIVETAGDQEVVQYRGQIMPLIRVSQVIKKQQKQTPEAAAATLHVVVYAGDKGRSVGLVVDRILDIVEEPFVMQPQTGRPGVLGSAVIQQRVTDILDVAGLIGATDANQLVAGTKA